MHLLPCKRFLLLAALSTPLLLPFPSWSEPQRNVPSIVPWFEASVVEELRFGSFEGPDEFIFGRISYMAIGPDGEIYVADGQLETLRVYDANGQFRHSIGRKGEGPGEYLMMLGMTALPDGAVAIYDGRNQRITLFRPNGTVELDFRIENTLFASDMLHHDDSGNLYVRSMDLSLAGPQMENGNILIKLTRDGEVVDRLALPDRESDTGIVLHTPEGPQRNFVVSTLWAWSPSGYVVTGRNDEYSLEIRDPEGARRKVNQPYEPIAVHPEERSEWQAWDRYFQRADLRNGRPAISRNTPEWKPAFKELNVGDDGRIWVKRYVAAEERDVPPREPGDERPLLSWREPQVFDIFEPDGTFLGTIQIPRDTRILARRGNHMWGVHTTDTGERVVRLRIEPRSL